jgi:hypothetical protein
MDRSTPFAFVKDKKFYLWHAIRNGNSMLGQKLLLTMKKDEKNRVDREGRTPLYLSVEKKNWPLALMLIHDRDVDINIRCTEQKVTTLYLAEQQNYANIISLLQ